MQIIKMPGHYTYCLSPIGQSNKNTFFNTIIFNFNIKVNVKFLSIPKMHLPMIIQLEI